MIEQLTDLFGPVGYVMGITLVAGTWLYKTERTERTNLQARFDQLQEKRVEESRDTTKELFAATQTLEKAISQWNTRT